MDAARPPRPPRREPILTAGPSMSAASGLRARRRPHGWNSRWSRLPRPAGIDVRRLRRGEACDRHVELYGRAAPGVAGAGIGPGDEVIVPELTWVATASAVLYRGATPIFADVEPDSWCIDPESVRSLITPQTRAIMPVHLYGHPAQADAICQIAAEHGLTVIEDAAPAIGAELRGRRVGTLRRRRLFQLPGRQAPGHRRGRHDRHRRRQLVEQSRCCGITAATAPAPSGSSSRVQVQDVQPAGCLRAGPAGARRPADRGQAADLRLVRARASRTSPASRSTTRRHGRDRSTG